MRSARPATSAPDTSPGGCRTQPPSIASNTAGIGYLREQLDGAVGHLPGNTGSEERGADFWDEYRGKVEWAAKAADQEARRGESASDRQPM